MAFCSFTDCCVILALVANLQVKQPVATWHLSARFCMAFCSFMDCCETAVLVRLDILGAPFPLGVQARSEALNDTAGKEGLAPHHLCSGGMLRKGHEKARALTPRSRTENKNNIRI